MPCVETYFIISVYRKINMMCCLLFMPYYKATCRLRDIHFNPERGEFFNQSLLPHATSLSHVVIRIFLSMADAAREIWRMIKDGCRRLRCRYIQRASMIEVCQSISYYRCTVWYNVHRRLINLNNISLDISRGCLCRYKYNGGRYLSNGELIHIMAL